MDISTTNTQSPTPLLAKHSIGLAYAITTAVGFLVIFSTILLSSYICRRLSRRHVAQNANELQNVVVGLHQAVINSYPRFVFSRMKGNMGNDVVCSICLCEYRESEMLRMLPDCRHCFHAMCVDTWLKLNASCPVCRNSPQFQ